MSRIVAIVAAFPDPAALLAAVDTALGMTGWHEFPADAVAGYLAATATAELAPRPSVDDHAGAPGGPQSRVPAYLLLGLAPAFADALAGVEGYAGVAPYGLERVRFPAPLPPGSRVRASGRLLSAKLEGNGMRAVVELIYACEAHEASPCVAEVVTLLVPDGRA